MIHSVLLKIKKNLLPCFFVMVGILPFSSCEKDDASAEQEILFSFIKKKGFIYNDTIWPSDSTFRIGFQVLSPGMSDVDLTNVRIASTFPGDTTILMDSTFNSTKFNFNKQFVTYTDEVQNIWLITVTDSRGGKKEYGFTITTKTVINSY